jgi:dihydrofolate reductase
MVRRRDGRLLSITLVACADMNLGIGNENNELLFKLPKDMKHFKSVTSGKVVVMGRKTWDSLPKKPLPKRKNYVLTNNKDFSHVGAKVIHSVEDVLKLSKTHEVFVIGGGEIYAQLMPHADKMILTHVHVVDGSATTFFPDFNHEQWDLVSMTKHEEDESHGHSFTFANYTRIKED